jgi:hypothetical protein
MTRFDASGPAIMLCTAATRHLINVRQSFARVVEIDRGSRHDVLAQPPPTSPTILDLIVSADADVGRLGGRTHRQDPFMVHLI